MRVTTWNVRGLTGKEQELVQEISKMKEYNQYKNVLKDPNLDGMITLIEWMTKEQLRECVKQDKKERGQGDDQGEHGRKGYKR